MKKLKSLWAVLSRLRRSNADTPVDPHFEQDDEKYMVDFRPDRFAMFDASVESGPNSDSSTPLKPETVAVPVKPKDVLSELGSIPTNWSLQALDAKLSILRDKRKLINQRFAAAEVDGLIQCLENRKKYDRKSKTGETFRQFFSGFDATDQLHIDAVVKKHKLVMKSADIFVPELPDVAVKAMTAYKDKALELGSKEPRFFVIANAQQFREANGKRDPILLAQSPFGFYYYILGAWDEEMLYLPEL